MQSPASLSPAIPLSDAVESLLRHFPEDVRAAYVSLRTTGDAAAADKLVLAIVADHMPRKEADLRDDAELLRDLGFDSVAIAEMVFFIEDLLQVNVSNAEIMRVRTVRDLRAFVRQKLESHPAFARPAASRP
jgi:acyl carrier protein